MITHLIISLSFFMNSYANEMEITRLFTPLDQYVLGLQAEFANLDQERKESLQELAAFIEARYRANEGAELVFICTHNSRRSHISQIWAQAAAYYYGFDHVKSYSGGTEATAFNLRAVEAMKRAGFKIDQKTMGTNPEYLVSFSETAEPIMAFSKVYSSAPNPKQNFCAIMTCSDADQNCPLVSGARKRVALPYDDPKNFDNTELETVKYNERVRQIGVELMYVFSIIKR